MTSNILLNWEFFLSQDRCIILFLFGKRMVELTWSECEMNSQPELTHQQMPQGGSWQIHACNLGWKYLQKTMHGEKAEFGRLLQRSDRLDPFYSVTLTKQTRRRTNN